MIEKPQPGEYNPFYETYVSKVPEGDMLAVLNAQAEEIPSWLRSLSDKADYRYEEGKWSIAEVLHHCIDTERIFSYRAMSIARGEKQSLPGMDQDNYMAAAHTDERSFESLIREFEAVRSATLTLAESFSPKVVGNEGTASGSPVTVRGLVAIITGHLDHHMRVVKERYL